MPIPIASQDDIVEMEDIVFNENSPQESIWKVSYAIICEKEYGLQIL